MSIDVAEQPFRFIADEALLRELAPSAERLVDRHLETCKDWLPHEYIPYGLGRTVVMGELWSPDELPVSEGVRSALFVNTLTEDNLPYYFEALNRFTGGTGIEVWRYWTHRWTAEEMRHSHALRTFIEIARPIDPTSLEKARMLQVTDGKVPDPETTADGLVYVPLQELATRIAHMRTGNLLMAAAKIDRPMRQQQLLEAGGTLTKRVAVDENFHFIFYRDLASVAFQLDPSKMIIATNRQVPGFGMPGTGIVGFKRHALQIAGADIYNTAIHYDDVLKPVVLDTWKIADLTGLSPEAEQAREELMAYIGRLANISAKKKQRAADRIGQAQERED